MAQRYIAVFCGARRGEDPRYAALTQDVARALVGAGFGVVYGGGRVGLMGVLADEVLRCGGTIVGVIPESLSTAEIAHSGLSKLHVVRTMHERKALMAELSDAFVALPGGYGTMDEFCEILTWRQLHIHDKPIALLNSFGFFDELLALFQKFFHEGFVPDTSRGLFITSQNIGDLVDALQRKETT